MGCQASSPAAVANPIKPDTTKEDSVPVGTPEKSPAEKPASVAPPAGESAEASGGDPLQGYRKGDVVEIWSATRNEWVVDGVIVEAATVACTVDGYAIPPGAVQVTSSAGTKWILPDQLASMLRRPAATMATPKAKVEETLCKAGCGRPVQPGMTRGMKKFDTCCKKCAMSGGTGEHDKNCGGAAVAASPSKAGGADAHEWLSSMLSNAAELEKHADAVFAKQNPDSEGFITQEAGRKAIGTALLEPIDVKLDPGGQLGKGAKLDRITFRDVCRTVLRDRMDAWFPKRLPAKAQELVSKNPSKSEDVYEFGPLVGEGSFGKVYTVKHRVSGEARVCKKIMKLKGKAGMKLEEIIKEIESMAMVDHPNLIKVYEFFEDSGCVMQILETCSGGELHDKIEGVFKKGQTPYTEGFMCDVMKQALRALAFMHGERIMHKDLKPQNIMLTDTESSSIKIIDFGLAELFEKDQQVSTQFGGTLLYMGPEVFRSELSFKSDIWSLGVILYNLITGDYPFMAQWPLPPGKDMDWWQRELQRSIQEDQMKQHAKLTSNASAACRSLLVLMLGKDPGTRPGAAECLKHEWFKQFEEAPPPLSIGVTQCLDAYAGQHELKKACFLLIAHQCTAPALTELRAIFTHFDVDNRGALSQAVFLLVLQRTGMTQLRAARIIHALDRDDSGSIAWTEFVAAALCVSVCREHRLVDTAFAVFDKDRDNKINQKDIINVFAKGVVEEQWKLLLPRELAHLAEMVDEKDKKGGKKSSAPVNTSGPFTKEQFRSYMGKGMNATSGDALSLVD